MYYLSSDYEFIIKLVINFISSESITPKNTSTTLLPYLLYESVKKFNFIIFINSFFY